MGGPKASFIKLLPGKVITDKIRKNILFLHHAADWYGADKIIYNVIELLSREHNCFIALPYHGVLNDKLKSLPISCHTFNFPVFRKKYLKIYGPFLLIVECFIALPKLITLLINKRIDIIYSNTFTIVIGVFLAFIFRKKHCWHVHEIISEPKAFKLFIHWCARHLSHLNICVSQAVADNIGQFPSIKVVHNGIDPIIEKPIFSRKNNQKFLIGVFGRFNSWKGQLDAVKAVQESLVEKGNKESLRLLLVGSYFENQKWWLEDVVDYIRKNNLNAYVEIRDFTEKIGVFYKTIDLFILPSILPDPFPTVVLESMSAGVPVIGYRHGGIVEMLQDDKDCLVAPRDYRVLAERITYFNTHNEEREKKARKQYDFFMKNFTKENYYKRYLPAFEVLLSLKQR